MASSLFSHIARPLAVLGLLALAPATRAADLKSAEQLLLRGHADEAAATLHQLPLSGEQHLLLCRTFLAEQLGDQAVPECEAALAANNNSITQDWMGRAYGMQASHAGPIAGLRLAGKVRGAFEAAVRLDPHSPSAVDDLSDYYVDAPGVVGGGTDKAHALAVRVAPTLPQSAHRTHALAAEKDSDYGTAEREFKAAAAVHDAPGAWSDLGNYYARRKQYTQSLDALRHAVAVDHAGPTTADCAEILISSHQHPELAEQWLRTYLNGHAQTDEQPVFKIHVVLGKLLARRGDKNAARDEYNQALALASQFEPAHKALHSL